MYSNIKTLKCNNLNSKYEGILNDDIIKGKITCNFVFKVDSENCFWPIESSLYDLYKDGWELV